MKSSKLIDIFKKGNMVIPLFLLQNYKEFNLKAEEFLVLMYLYNLGDNFVFDPSKYSNDLNMDFSEVMTYIAALTDKNFVSLTSKKNDNGIMEEFLSLDGFYSRISMLTIDEVNKDEEEKDYGVIDVIEKEFGRTVSPIEFEIVKAWVDSGINEGVIIEAIKEAVLNGVFNLRYIDKIIYEWGKLGIKTVDDVNNNRKKRNAAKEQVSEEVDMDVIDWDWFDDGE